MVSLLIIIARKKKIRVPGKGRLSFSKEKNDIFSNQLRFNNMVQLIYQTYQNDLNIRILHVKIEQKNQFP